MSRTSRASVAVLLLAGCLRGNPLFLGTTDGGSGGAGGQGGAGQGGGTGRDLGSMICSGPSLANDLHDCGSCGHDCTRLPGVDVASMVCMAGACYGSCLAGLGDCSSSVPGCETNLTTAANCGRCGNRCASGLCASDTSGSFQCVATCSPGAPTECSGTCVDTRSDPFNCGGCGVVCDHGNGQCLGGRCGAISTPDLARPIPDMTTTGSTCAHSYCAVGAALEASCDPCVAAVCQTDPGCCSSSWTTACISDTFFSCNVPCP
jgi:hypothetical protein